MMDAETPQIINLFFPPSTAIRNEDVSPCSRPHSEPPEQGSCTRLYNWLQLKPGPGGESGMSLALARLTKP